MQDDNHGFLEDAGVTLIDKNSSFWPHQEKILLDENPENFVSRWFETWKWLLVSSFRVHASQLYPVCAKFDSRFLIMVLGALWLIFWVAKELNYTYIILFGFRRLCFRTRFPFAFVMKSSILDLARRLDPSVWYKDPLGDISITSFCSDYVTNLFIIYLYGLFICIYCLL